jgi:hypothetical protein
MSSKDSGSIDWAGYYGFELATADRVRLGFVADIVADAHTGEPILYVVKPTDRSRILRVPTSLVGVITSQRLMLDVTEKDLGKLGLEIITDSTSH